MALRTGSAGAETPLAHPCKLSIPTGSTAFSYPIPLLPPGLSYRWLLNEFPNFIPTDGRHFVSQTTGNLYIARTNASDLGNYSCLATSHMDFSTKSVFSKFAQLNLAAEGQEAVWLGSRSQSQRPPPAVHTLWVLMDA